MTTQERTPGADTATASAGGSATAQEPRSSNELAQIRTDLGLQRTVMAADRSLMAWIRTALSMISFGFTIYKLLQGFQQSGSFVDGGSPRAVGLFLTGLGTIAMLIGSVEYWYRLRTLSHIQPLKVVQPTFVMAIVMSVTGLFLFVGIISKLL